MQLFCLIPVSFSLSLLARYVNDQVLISDLISKIMALKRSLLKNIKSQPEAAFSNHFQEKALA